MKKDTTADRLKQLMNEYGIRQVDILKRAEPFCRKYDVKMNKSDISQYVSGKVIPSQDKLVILGMALGVREGWLMGFDVPRNRKENAQEAERDVELLYKFSLLNERDQKLIIQMIDSMIGDS